MSLSVAENCSLKKFNTFNLDVKAKRLITIRKDDDYSELINLFDEPKEPKLFLGGGSNILFLNDFPGLVVHLTTKGIKIVSETEDSIELQCEAGELWDDVVSFAVSKKYYGIENMALIPGTIGAAPIQNIGAYGSEIKDVLVSVTGIDLVTKETKTLTNADCEFDYRSSIFKTTLKGRFLIKSVLLRLSKKKKFHLNYRALKEKFGHKSEENISIEKVAEYIKRIRNEKLPDIKTLGNAGSFFKNPEISKLQLNELKEEFPKIISFSTTIGTYKVAAGWLIEECGFRGKRIGDVSCYSRQALVIVNHGNATGTEIIEYASQIQSAVKAKFNIVLTPEVNIIK